MSLNESKEKLHILIEQIDDAKLLEAYSDLIQREIKNSNKQPLDFTKLPPAVQTALKQSLSQSKKNKVSDAISYLNSLKK